MPSTCFCHLQREAALHSSGGWHGDLPGTEGHPGLRIITPWTCAFAHDDADADTASSSSSSATSKHVPTRATTFASACTRIRRCTCCRAECAHYAHVRDRAVRPGTITRTCASCVFRDVTRLQQQIVPPLTWHAFVARENVWTVRVGDRSLVTACDSNFDGSAASLALWSWHITLKQATVVSWRSPPVSHTVPVDSAVVDVRRRTLTLPHRHWSAQLYSATIDTGGRDTDVWAHGAYVADVDVDDVDGMAVPDTVNPSTTRVWQRLVLERRSSTQQFLLCTPGWISVVEHVDDALLHLGPTHVAPGWHKWTLTQTARSIRDTTRRNEQWGVDLLRHSRDVRRVWEARRDALVAGIRRNARRLPRDLALLVVATTLFPYASWWAALAEPFEP
jgi:hypothetical protein